MNGDGYLDEFIFECNKADLLATVDKLRILADKLMAIANTSRDSQELEAYVISTSMLAKFIEIGTDNYESILFAEKK